MDNIYKKILRIPAGFSEWVLNIESPFRWMRPSMWDVVVVAFLSSALFFGNIFFFSPKTMLIFGSGYVIFRMLMRRL